MSKKTKDPAAQRLIDDLLDDSNPGVPDLSLEGEDESPAKSRAEKSMIFELDDYRKSELPPEPDFTAEILKELTADLPEISTPDFSRDMSKDISKDISDEFDKTMNVAEIPKAKVPSVAPPVTASATDDRTMRIGNFEAAEASKKQKADSRTATEIRLGALSTAVDAKEKQYSAPVIPGMAVSSADATLRQSESMRIAQTRILDLENELERIRRENEQLAVAGETLRRRADELQAKSENLSNSLSDKEKIYEEERKLLRAHLSGKDRELYEQRQKLDELEQRLETNFKKIRVRERDLEHRLEIAKVEHASLLSSKDKMILDLKRQVDQLTTEAEYSKSKSHELYNQYKDKQDTVRRVVRALRIALSILEGEDDSSAPSKKVD